MMHVFAGDGGPGAGFMHPLTGPDHLLAMYAVGVVSAQIGGRAIWTVPAAFVAMMVAGGILGATSGPLPATELGVAMSVVVLGAAVAGAGRVPAWTALAAAGFFGAFHGYAHGAEMPAAVSPALYVLGFVVATAGLHVLGALSGLLVLCRPHADARLRWAGVVIGLIGAWFVWSASLHDAPPRSLAEPSELQSDGQRGILDARWTGAARERCLDTCDDVVRMERDVVGECADTGIHLFSATLVTLVIGARTHVAECRRSEEPPAAGAQTDEHAVVAYTIARAKKGADIAPTIGEQPRPDGNVPACDDAKHTAIPSVNAALSKSQRSPDRNREAAGGRAVRVVRRLRPRGVRTGGDEREQENQASRHADIGGWRDSVFDRADLPLLRNAGNLRTLAHPAAVHLSRI